MSPRANARPPADAEPAARPATRALVGGAELDRAMRLLEVIAEDLLVLAGAVPQSPAIQAASRACRSARTAFGIAW